MASIQEMLTDSLRDMYDAERQAVKSLPRLARAASSPELKQALNDHAEVSKGQVARLEQVFDLLGERAKAKPCRAMQGLVEEAMQHVSEHEKGSELDAILVSSAQKIEHYEIAAYGTARAMAKSARQRDAANLLQETLKEEGATDKLLTTVALDLYKEMVREEGQSAEGVEEEEAFAAARSRSSRRAPVAARKQAARGGTASRTTRSARNGGSRNGAMRQTVRGNKAGSAMTIDHDQIRRWAEARGAHPACVRGTGGRGDKGLLRLDFPGYSGRDSLQEISWDEFFEKFDQQGLALLYQDSTARGQKSNFNKLVSRETARLAASGSRGSSRGGRSVSR